MIKGKSAGKHSCHCDGKGKSAPKGERGARVALIIGMAKAKKGSKS
jgi:hypothetical protein